ncbi:MAG: sodium:proton antiporter [Terracidiphilus sp.]|nr:sodium:proton antiporter [Terracidiphilus sp.]
MEIDFQIVTLLLLASAVVAMLSRRLHLPYSVGLVLAGIAMAALHFAPHVALTRDLLFTALLPPLLFEGAYHLCWPQLRREAPLLATLVTAGVLVSAAVTATGLHFLLGWPWIAAAIFGSLIAATDPVSVIATFKESKAQGRLLTLLEAESLFNDGTAAVLFAVVLAIAAGQQPTPLAIGLLLLKTAGGGILCGLAVGLAALVLVWRTQDHLVEMTISAVAAWGSFFLADRLGLSGVLATIAAGILLGNIAPHGIVTERGREAIHDFWEFAAFLANSIVFLLIGMHEATQNFRGLWLPACVAIALVLLSRAATVWPCCLLFRLSALRVSACHQLALFWGGLRGALALALALSLPDGIPCREPILTFTFAVVAFSIFAQGLTITPLLRRIGEIPPRIARLETEEN